MRLLDNVSGREREEIVGRAALRVSGVCTQTLISRVAYEACDEFVVRAVLEGTRRGVAVGHIGFMEIAIEQ